MNRSRMMEIGPSIKMAFQRAKIHVEPYRGSIELYAARVDNDDAVRIELSKSQARLLADFLLCAVAEQDTADELKLSKRQLELPTVSEAAATVSDEKGEN